MSDFDKKDIAYPIELQKPSVRFIQITHTSENAAKVWGEAKKYDIILREVIDLSEEERKKNEETINQVSSIKDPLRRKKILGDLYNDDSFVSQIYRNVILEGKEFHYVDTPITNKATSLQNESDVLQDKALWHFQIGEFDLSFLYQKDSIIAQAQCDYERENLVAEQIEHLIQENSIAWKGKSICVIQGGFHTRTYRLFKKDHPEIKSSRMLDNEKIIFFIEKEAEERILVGTLEDREATMKRLFISRRIILPQTSSMLDFGERMKTADKIARSLKNDEIDSIFGELSEIQTYIKEQPREMAGFAIPYVNKHIRILGRQIIEKHPLFPENST